MFIKIVKAVVGWGLSFLEKRNIDIYQERLTEEQKKVIELERQIDIHRSDIYNLRFELLVKYDNFVAETQNAYLHGLAVSEDQALKTTMTQHWVNSHDVISGMVHEHTQLVAELSELVEELGKIRVVNNQD